LGVRNAADACLPQAGAFFIGPLNLLFPRLRQTMDFELTERQRKIQNSAREFIQSEFDKDKIREWDRTHTFPREIWKKASQSGFIGIHFPQEYGGQGTGIMEK